MNAVGRRVAERGAPLWEAASEALLPEWLEAPVEAAYGPEAAAGIAVAHHRRPPIDLTLKVPGEMEDWAARLGAAVLPTGSLRVFDRVRVSGLPGYDSGAWWVQDAAAAVPVRMLGALGGSRVLDLCAAPGGKTMQLAAAGARVMAVDASAGRIGTLRENLRRADLEAEVVAADALVWQPGERFDAVVVDAPCSATGTIRRHPDLPYLRTGREIPALVALQEALLRRAWGWLAPGGRMLYCTCSLLPVEGEERIAAFLERGDARVIRPDPAALGIEAEWLDAAGGLRLRPDYWPERGGMDGFYAALLEKPR